MKFFYNKCLFFATVFLSLSSVGQPLSSEVEIIRERIIANEFDRDVAEKEVDELVNSMSSDGTWSYIDYSDVSRTGFQHAFHLRNLVSMALAYRKESSHLRNNERLKVSFNKALNFWLVNNFLCDNWWHNQIGTPTALTSVLLIMDEELSASQIAKIAEINNRANLNASGARPSGDRIKIAGILAKNLLFDRNPTQFEEVITVIEGEIKFTTGSRGMQHDYSFHHRVDRVNNTTSYGKGFADAFAEWADYVAGTKYAFAQKPIQQLTDYYLDGICKQVAFGKFTDFGVMNRGISRSEGYGNYTETKSLKRLLRASDYRNGDVTEIINIREGELDVPKPFAKFFWQSEHFTLQRQEFFTSVRMHSVRNDNMEVPYNGEGLKNHHRGDGTSYLTKSGLEYTGTPPVYDWQKIPGATILQKLQLPSEKEIQKKGLTEFVGAVTDGYYGVVGYDFKSPHDPLSARKSWFFFDKTYVCLGAGISSTSNLEVVTTVNQVKLNGKVIIKTTGGERMLAEGERELEEVQWVLHDGVGYVFLGKQNLRLSNKEESGSWFSINTQSDSPKATVSLPMFKLWLSHENRPTDASYAYVVVPRATPKLLNSKPLNNLKILYNTSKLQAVIDTKLQICQMVFYESGSVQISEDIVFNAETPGIVMLKLNGKEIEEVSVSDPTRKLQEFSFKVNQKLSSVSEQISKISTKPDGESSVSIRLQQGFYAGSSITVMF